MSRRESSELIRQMMVAGLQQSPPKTPEEKAAEWAAMQNAYPRMNLEGLQNLIESARVRAPLSAGTPIRWYHRLWWRVKRWWT